MGQRNDEAHTGAPVERRTVVKGAVGVAAVAAAVGPFGPFEALAAAERKAKEPWKGKGGKGKGGKNGKGRKKALGPLKESPDMRDGVVRMSLPEGFVYRSFGVAGDITSDGVTTPGRQDGMAAFWGPKGTIRVVRNHEVRGEGAPMGDASKAYDGNTLGGCITLDIDPDTRELLGDWVSLTGTSVNCAGGPTPWGTWISAEETVNGPDLGEDFTGADGPAAFERHGYIFEVDPKWGKGEHHKAVPIRSAGRFAKEATAWDAKTGALYITEDNFEFPSGMYRYKPKKSPWQAGGIVDGGKLQMLRVKGSKTPALLGLPQGAGAQFDVDWVTIDQPDFDATAEGWTDTTNDTGIQFVGKQGFAKGAAAFARNEGCWIRNGIVYFTATRGGGEGLSGNRFGEYGNGFGQVWALDAKRGKLTLIFESSGPDVLDLPDNLTISKRGNIIICEDGSTDNYIRCLNRRGELTDVALNSIEGSESQEFAGACFSPDNRTMFVNIQFGDGLTFAIWRKDGKRLGI